MIVEASRTINLGKQGDNDFTVVKFDVSGWSAYGDGIFSLNHKRSIDCSAYPCVVSYENGFVYWTIKATDTQFAGNGLAQLVYSNEDGVIIHTEIYNTFVAKSLVTTDTPPEPFRPWVDRITGMIETETAQRMADDEELANAIDEEAGTRAATDTTLNNKIEAEAQQRAEEDAELWEAVGGAVSDVQISGTSIVTDGVANISDADEGKRGVFRPSLFYGTYMYNGILMPVNHDAQQFSTDHSNFFIGKGTLNNVLSAPSIMPALTDAEKAAARSRIGVNEELIASVTLSEDATTIEISVDSHGNSFDLNSARAILLCPTNTDARGASNVCIINKSGGSTGDRIATFFNGMPTNGNKTFGVANIYKDGTKTYGISSTASSENGNATSIYSENTNGLGIKHIYVRATSGTQAFIAGTKFILYGVRA